MGREALNKTIIYGVQQDASGNNQQFVPIAINSTGELIVSGGLTIEQTILASAARTASANSADFTNQNSKGAHFVVNVSAITATPSIVVTIQGKDSISGNYYDLLVSTNITTVGTTILKIYPGLVTAINAAASDILPRTFRASIVNADADSITYSISANLVG